MKITDAHVHIWRPELVPSQLRMTWASYAANRTYPAGDPEIIYPKVTKAIADPEGLYLRQALKLAGISKAIIVGVDFAVRAGAEAERTTREATTEYAKLADQDSSLSFVAGVDPRRPDAAEMATNAMDVLGALGIKIYPPAGVPPDSPETIGLCGLVEEREATVLIHTGTAPAGLDTRLAWPGHVTELQQRYPSLRIVLCHAGYPAWFEDAVAVASTHPRTYIELSRWQQLAFDHRQRFLDMFKWALSVVGSERILFATDVSCGAKNYESRAASMRRWIDVFVQLEQTHVLSEEELELIFWGNASQAFAHLDGGNRGDI